METSPPIPLWPGAAPGALGDQPHDTPAITVYPPSAPASGAAMLVCPGGGYARHAPHEGHDYALWLGALGITSFVLRYRLGADGYRHPTMLHDAARAVRLIRSRAAQWGVDGGRVGVMGSSAGGHLASALLTHGDAGAPGHPDPAERESSRPDLGVLCYPVIAMGDIAHQGSRENLVGLAPSDALVAEVSSDLRVTAATPACFLWHTAEDEKVSVEHSLRFATALARHAVPFELHIYEQGRHGLGLADQPPFAGAHPWAGELRRWLRERGFIGLQ